METTEVIKRLEEKGIEYAVNVPAKSFTSFQTGGNIDIVVYVKDENTAAAAAEAAVCGGFPYFVVGNASNLLVSDKGYRGMIIKTVPRLSGIEIKGDVIFAEAGVLLSKCASAAAAEGLEGMEFAYGIPGTVGGALYMNAGAYGSEMKNIVLRTEYYYNGEINIAEKEGHCFGNRDSIFRHMPGCIIIKTELALKKGTKENITARMKELSAKRRASQPLEYPSAGSVFKRPEGCFAGKLIEDCGLKGLSIGGAEVSEKHAGFIINRKGATSEDIYRLIIRVQDEVSDRFGIKLCPEIIFLGEF